MRDLNTPNNSKIEKEFPFEHHKTCKYAEQAIVENLKRFPGITQDQAAGREKVTINGKIGFLNGDGELGFMDGTRNFSTFSKLEEVTQKNLKRFSGITQDQATGREEVTIDGKTGFLNGDGKLGTIDGDGKFVTYERLDKITKDNLKRYPNITQDQAAGREEITINGKTGFLNGDGEII